MKISTIIYRHLKLKLAAVLVVTASMAAFATLGDGGKKHFHSKKLLSAKTSIANFKSFSLRSGYNYRGNTVFSTAPASNKYIMLNTVVTYEKGNNTYILPMKRKVLLTDKVKFTPR